MQFDLGFPDESWYAAIVLFIIAGLVFHHVRSKAKREQVGTAALVAVFAFFGAKEAFVRHGGVLLFALMLVVVAAFGLSAPSSRAYYVTAVAFIGILAWSTAGGVPTNLLTESIDAHSFGHEINTLANGRLQASVIRKAGTTMRKEYALGYTMIPELQGHTVAIEPFENNVAWAFPSIRWDPEPVLQAYAAYTSSLDELDARFIESSAAPSRILEQRPTAIDDRDPFFDPPTTVVTIVCHYVQLVR